MTTDELLRLLLTGGGLGAIAVVVKGFFEELRKSHQAQRVGQVSEGDLFKALQGRIDYLERLLSEAIAERAELERELRATQATLHRVHRRHPEITMPTPLEEDSP